MGNVILQSETMKPSMNLLLNVESVGLTPDQFYRLCSDNPELRLELTARKEIVIMPPAPRGRGTADWRFSRNAG